MKNNILIVLVFLLVGCSSENGSSSSSAVDTSNVKTVAPYGIHLGMSKDELNKLYSPEFRKNNELNLAALGKPAYGKKYFSERFDERVGRMEIQGLEITDNLLGDKYLFSSQTAEKFEWVVDTESSQSYVSDISVQRLYQVKGSCAENMAPFKEIVIDKIGVPKRIAKDANDEFKAYYQERIEKRNEVGKKIREGKQLRIRISCHPRHPHRKIFLQIFGTDYDLERLYLTKK